MNEPIQDIKNNIAALRHFILQQLNQYFGRETTLPSETPSFTVDIVAGNRQLQEDEKIILLVALAPHLQPNFFESLIQEVLPQGGDFPQFGGVRGSHYRGFLPTGETAQFILAGDDFEKRIQLQKRLLGESILIKENIVELEMVKRGEPLMSGRLMISDEWLHRLLTGNELSPKFSADFPAKKITTQMTWDDLVLSAYTQEQIHDIVTWLQHHQKISDDEVLGRKVKPGYRILFHGPPGTGKTLTAALLGKQFEREVYRVDISQMVSKYIGETEKNLEKVFTRAEHKDWILFFDEADALFGKRTNVQSSHDRYANQEVSYLLQRVEDYPGLLILASNFKSNMDDAFLRRFHSIIHFPAPKVADRLKLWQKTLPKNYTLEPAVSLAELAEKYDLNGATILNVVHSATLKAASRNDAFIRCNDIIEAIRKEYRKEERSMN